MDVIVGLFSQYKSDLFIGIIAGIISGTIVNSWSKVYRYHKSFSEDQQLFIRWIDKILICLEQAYDVNDFTIVLWTIADEPIRNSFTYLKESYIESVENIQQLINDMKYIILQNKNISKHDISKYKSELIKYKSQILDYKYWGIMKRTLYDIKKKE